MKLISELSILKKDFHTNVFTNCFKRSIICTKNAQLCEKRHSPDGPSLHGLGEEERLIDIIGHNTGRESVLGRVGALDGFVDVAELEDGLDGSEDLLLGDSHVVLDIGEDRGLDEVALLAPATPTRHARRALLLP